MDERYYPTDRFTEHLATEHIPAEKQDLVSLLEILPGALFKNGQVYHLMLLRDLKWFVSYVTARGSEFHGTSASRLPDALARMVVYLSEIGELKH